MLIDADSNNVTGLHGIDYQVEVAWENSKWNRTFTELSVNGNRIIDQKVINPIPFGNSPKYLPLSVNLDSIGNPPQYRIIFYAARSVYSTETGIFFNEIDYSHEVEPPLKFAISIVPESVDLTPGGRQKVSVQVTSTTGFESQVYLYAENRTNDIKLNFIPKKLIIPPLGEASSLLYINASEGGNPGPYPSIVYANLSTLAENSIGKSSSNNSSAKDEFASIGKSSSNNSSAKDEFASIGKSSSNNSSAKDEFASIGKSSSNNSSAKDEFASIGKSSSNNSSAKDEFASIGKSSSNNSSKSDFSTIELPTLSFVKSERRIGQSSFLITVRPLIPISEQILAVLNKLSFPISFISGIITGHIGPWLLKKFKEKRKESKYKKIL